MRFDLTFFGTTPFLHNVSYSFLEKPKIDGSLKPLRSFELLEIPFLKKYILNKLNDLLETEVVWPSQIHLDYYTLFGVEENQASSKADIKNVKQADLPRHTMQVQESKSKGGK